MKSRFLNVNRLFGQPAPIVYKELLLSFQDLAGATICHYETPPSLQQRVRMTNYEESILQTALTIRESSKFPFWEALLCAALRAGTCPESLLDASLYHAGIGVETRIIRQELTTDRLIGCTEDATNVGLSSKIDLISGDVKHLIFLDFHCEISEANTLTAERVCHRLLPSGFILLNSGDSYHATSIEMVTKDDRIRLLGKALLLSPIIDATYVAHQLQQDASSIRISKGGRAKSYPTVVSAHISKP